MSWWQAVLTIMLGNVIVLVPMMLNAHAGTKYGIPFPVLLRASFGTCRRQRPGALRALVACGWFGIQTWIGGSAIYSLHARHLRLRAGRTSSRSAIPVIGFPGDSSSCFLLFWAINIAVILARHRLASSGSRPGRRRSCS